MAVVIVVLLIFFFKQKTAYEMRISDWSSDVCSSDLFEGLDVQLSHQKFTVFLLGETASRRASVLSIGQESGHIQAMIARYRDNSNRDAATVRNGERDLEQVRYRLATLAGLDDARSKIGARKIRRLETTVPIVRAH